MKALGLTILLTFMAPTVAFAQSSLADVQKSHIDANVPTVGNFPRFLKRDLLNYLHTHGFPQATSVSFSLLRDGPTQSGVAYPKFYLWTQAFHGDHLLTQGAARVAAIAQSHFEVTSFLTSAAVRASPDQVSLVFPAPLVASIVFRAKTPQ
jgi:hypothetical protein